MTMSARYWILLFAILAFGSGSALYYFTRPLRANTPLTSFAWPQQCLLLSFIVGWLILSLSCFNWMAFTKAGRPTDANRQIFWVGLAGVVIGAGLLSRKYGPSLWRPRPNVSTDYSDISTDTPRKRRGRPPNVPTKARRRGRSRPQE